MKYINPDFSILEKMYSESDGNPCMHPEAIYQDENGVFHIHCEKCGRYGMTNETGARTLGWIE